MLVIYSCTELTVHHQYHHPLTQIQITAITSHFRDNKSLCFLSLHPLFYFKERIYMGLGFKRLITAWHCNTEYTFCVGVGMRTNRVTRHRRHVTRVTWLCVTTWHVVTRLMWRVETRGKTPSETNYRSLEAGNRKIIFPGWAARDQVTCVNFRIIWRLQFPEY